MCGNSHVRATGRNCNGCTVMWRLREKVDSQGTLKVTPKPIAGIWFILSPRRSHVSTLGTKSMLYSCMDHLA